MVCSALIVTDTTIGIVLLLPVPICVSLTKDNERFVENYILFLQCNLDGKRIEIRQMITVAI